LFAAWTPSKVAGASSTTIFFGQQKQLVLPFSMHISLLRLQRTMRQSFILPGDISAFGVILEMLFWTRKQQE
jgi:hypothetical protein